MQEHNGFNIVGANLPPMKKITTIGKGSIPDALLGDYTSAGQAMKAIDSHVRAKKAKKDAKTK